ncbi:hypothetical protein GF319_11575 [Candidatus Bathyarchaeota archaeon]|nr:hypothetical protein [Candidatus Bathyarchaeota archaeon]
MAVKESIELVSKHRKYLLPLTIIVVVITIGYNSYNSPPPIPEPLIIEIDGEDYPDKGFDESYDYSGFGEKSIRFLYPVTYSEFSSRREPDFTEYWSDSVEEAWEIIEEMDCPQIILGLGEWLCSGTLEDKGVKFYGSIGNFQVIGSGEHVSTSLGDAEDRLYCEFHIARLEFFYYDDILGRDSFYSDPGEYVIIEKDYRTLGGVEPVWAYLVFLESEGQVRSVLIRFNKQ